MPLLALISALFIALEHDNYSVVAHSFLIAQLALWRIVRRLMRKVIALDFWRLLFGLLRPVVPFAFKVHTFSTRGVADFMTASITCSAESAHKIWGATPSRLPKGAELCTAINISILHKFENTKHKHFGSVGRYVFGVSRICYLASSNLQLSR